MSQENLFWELKGYKALTANDLEHIQGYGNKINGCNVYIKYPTYFLYGNEIKTFSTQEPIRVIIGPDTKALLQHEILYHIRLIECPLKKKN